MKRQIPGISEFYSIRTKTLSFHYLDIECIDAYRSKEFLSRNGKCYAFLFWLAAPNGLVSTNNLESLPNNKINRKFRNI